MAVISGAPCNAACCSTVLQVAGRDETVRRWAQSIGGHLGKAERVVDIAAGVLGGESGLLSLTSERLFFLPDGNPESPSLQFRLTEVTAVVYSSQTEPGVLWLKGAKGEAYELTDVAEDDGRRMIDTWGSA